MVMRSSDLYLKTNYLNKNIDYLFGTMITEYDMKSAGLSLLEYFHIIDDSKIEYLKKMDKESRNKEIGMMQKNKKIADQLNQAFIDARKLFFESNNIQDYEVLSIKKDAIFILRRKCSVLKFGVIEFVPKNVYYGYLYMNNCEFYYKDIESDLDVKGIGNDTLEYHKEYMLDFIKDIFNYANNKTRTEIIYFITDFIKAYRNRNLDVGYYREMNLESKFIINNDGEIMGIDGCDEDDIPNLDITHNYFNYLVPIVRVFL